MKYLVVFIAVIAAANGFADDAKIEGHYQQATLLRSQGKFAEAAEEISTGVAFNTENKELFAKCELLIAELYVELGMLEAAAVTSRQVEVLYPDSEFEAKAKTLCEKIKQLTKEAEPSGQSK